MDHASGFEERALGRLYERGEGVLQSFVEAAEIYARSPAALQLRAMNIIYETTKERGATILMPSSMVDSLNPSPAVLALTLAGSSVNAPASVRPPA